MRIPQYEQQVNTPNAPQFNQIADVRNDNLGAIADGLEQVYKVKLQEQEEAQKTAFFQADNSIKMGLYKAKAELMDKIKNGGSYANAEAEYQKAHDAIIAQFGSAFDADKSGNTKLRALSEYQADGLQNVMAIRDSVTSRRKSDTAASANLRSEQLGQQLAIAKTPEEADAIRKQMTSLYAGATAAMGDNPAEGKLRARRAIQGAEANRISLFAQNNSKNPTAILQEVEKSKDLLDIDTYISMRGSALNEVEKLNTVDSVYSYLRDPSTNTPPKQESIDIFYESEINQKFKNNEISLLDYESSVVQSSVALNKVPTQIRNQVASFYAMEPAQMSNDDLETVASLSRMVSNISDKASRLTEGTIPKEDVAKAQLINRRMEAGMDVRAAFSAMKNAMDAEESRKIYAKAANEARALLTKNKISSDIPSYANMDFMDAYVDARLVSATESEAQILAEKQTKNLYQDFNGVKVKDAVTKYSKFDEKTWVAEANNAYEKVNGEKVSDDIKLGVYADSKTKKQIAEGKYPEYLISIYNPDGTFQNLLDLKTGIPIRLKEDVQYRTVKKRKVLSVGPMLKNIRFKTIDEKYVPFEKE